MRGGTAQLPDRFPERSLSNSARMRSPGTAMQPCPPTRAIVIPITLPERSTSGPPHSWGLTAAACSNTTGKSSHRKLASPNSPSACRGTRMLSGFPSWSSATDTVSPENRRCGVASDLIGRPSIVWILSPARIPAASERPHACWTRTPSLDSTPRLTPASPRGRAGASGLAAASRH